MTDTSIELLLDLQRAFVEAMTFLRRKYFTLIHNPTAGRRRWNRLAAVISALEDGGAIVETLTTQAIGHASELAKDRVGKADVIVAAGGDGTLAEVVSGVNGTDQLMGLIPLGTANVAALDMGLASGFGVHWSKVADVLLKAEPRPLHVGQLCCGEVTRSFIMMVGVGFDGDLVDDIDVGFKKRWGKLAYLRSGLHMIWRYRPKELLINGARGHWAIVTNGRHYAGPYILAPNANLSDPQFQILVIDAPNRWVIVKAMIALGLGRLDAQSFVTSWAVDNVNIETIGPTAARVQVDGDVFHPTPISIKGMAKPVQFLMP